MFDIFYQNIGGKLKSWAKWIFIVEAIAAIIAECVVVIASIFINWLLCIILLFIIPLGLIAVLVSTWILYAFGELVEDVHAMRTKEPKCETKYNNKSTTKHNDNSTKKYSDPYTPQKICPICGLQHDFDYPKCPNCKYDYDENEDPKIKFIKEKTIETENFQEKKTAPKVNEKYNESKIEENFSKYDQWNAAYEAQGQPIGTCEMCGKRKRQLIFVEFEDFFGKGEKHMCYDCFVKYNATPKNKSYK